MHIYKMCELIFLFSFSAPTTLVTVPATLTFTFLSYPIVRLSYPIVRVSYKVFRLSYRENRLSGFPFIVYKVFRIARQSEYLGMIMHKKEKPQRSPIFSSSY